MVEGHHHDVKKLEGDLEHGDSHKQSDSLENVQTAPEQQSLNYGVKRHISVANRKLKTSAKGHAKSVGYYLSPQFLKRFVKAEWPYIVLLLLGIILVALLQTVAWDDLSGQGFLVLWVTMFCIVAMIRNFVDPDVVLFAGVTIFLLAGTIPIKEAFVGLSNDSIVAIALTVAIATGIENTGALDYFPKLMYGGNCFWAKWKWVGQVRMFSLVAIISAFINNTPLVAVMIPVMERYCRQTNQPPSQFMMPLSTAAILGGLCTIIGTSTNLIVKGLVAVDFPNVTLGFFEIGAVGVPMAVAGCIYVVLFSSWLLPKKGGAVQHLLDNPRKYSVSVLVEKNFPGINETLDVAGLRRLQRLYVTQIKRNNSSIIPAPTSETIIQLGDEITFSGDVDNLPQLLDLKGLTISGGLSVADYENSDLYPTSHSRKLVEAVIALASPLTGKTIKEAAFRATYGASVIAVYRAGETLDCATDLPLQGGDTLLLEAKDDFVNKYRLSPEFALVTRPFEVHPTKKDPIKLIVSIGLFVVMIVLNSTEVKELSVLALAVIYCYFLTGIMTVDDFRNSIPGMILLTIAGGFGFRAALQGTGVATKLADALMGAFEWMGAIGPVFGLYLATEVLTALLSNGAAVAMMYPVAKSIVKSQGGNGKTYWYALMLAASSDFMTPIGYQTNLMVMGPGGYKFIDYVKYGFGLQVVAIIIGSVGCFYIF